MMRLAGLRPTLPESACDLSRHWLIAPELSQRLVTMDLLFQEKTGRSLRIISGYRTPAQQQDLRDKGRPAAPDELSTHRICPATGADLFMEGFISRQHKVHFGEAAILAGLRWGGGSERVDGIPTDWNHVDLGPRTDPVAEEYRRNR